MQVELKLRGRGAGLEHRIPVRYKGEGVGDYAADLLVENRILVELKLAPEYQPADEAQLLNELKATGFKVGLPIILAGPKFSSSGWSFSLSVSLCGHLWRKTALSFHPLSLRLCPCSLARVLSPAINGIEALLVEAENSGWAIRCRAIVEGSGGMMRLKSAAPKARS